MTGPMGSGLPQLGLPRRLAIIGFALPLDRRMLTFMNLTLDSRNPPLVSILNEKNGWKYVTLEVKAHFETDYYRQLFPHLQPVYAILVSPFVHLKSRFAASSSKPWQRRYALNPVYCTV